MNLIVILQSDTTQDVVFNFIAVAIISDFDNFVFSSLRNEPLKELVVDGNSEFMKVQFTTSIDARSFKSGGEASEVTDEYGEPMYHESCHDGAQRGLQVCRGASAGPSKSNGCVHVLNPMR